MTARLVLVDIFLSLFTSLLLRTLRTERKTGLYILVLEQIVSLVAFALPREGVCWFYWPRRTQLLCNN